MYELFREPKSNRSVTHPVSLIFQDLTLVMMGLKSKVKRHSYGYFLWVLAHKMDWHGREKRVSNNIAFWSCLLSWTCLLSCLSDKQG